MRIGLAQMEHIVHIAKEAIWMLLMLTLGKAAIFRTSAHIAVLKWTRRISSIMRYLSVFENDSDILKAVDDIFLKKRWIDLDCTYSKGIFYKKAKEPRKKSDLNPLFDDVVRSDARELSFLEDESIESIVFDPPFLFRKRKSVNNDKISERFTYFSSFEELLKMYFKSMDCIYRKLKKGGFLLFKCQDMTDGKFYCTHNEIINYAKKIGFELKDIIIKRGKSKLQKDANQQNCVGKIHSYWLVFKKVNKRRADK